MCANRFHAAVEDDESELQSLITTEETYKSKGDTALSGIAKDQWHAKLAKSHYRAIAICCADPYRDQAREVCAVCLALTPARSSAHHLIYSMCRRSLL
jgi:hypothetical protein